MNPANLPFDTDTMIFRRCRARRCDRTASASRSYSKTLIGRSIRASRSAKPSPRVRSTTARRAPRHWRAPVNCSNWSIYRPMPFRAIRISSPAASASVSPSPAHWR